MPFPPTDAAGLAALVAATPQPVTAADLPLPAGAATDAAVRATASAHDVVAVVPSDTVQLAIVTKALLVTVAGNLTIKGASGVAITIPVSAGQLLPIQPTFVVAAGTTATVVALV